MTDGERDASRQEEISRLLAEWAQHDPTARDRLVPLVYQELHRLAHHYLSGERAGHTLQTTALVNELYMRVAGLQRIQWRDRAHFFAMAGRLMRRILVDHARERAADKRGGDIIVTSIVDHDVPAPVRGVNLLALDDALAELATIDAQQSKLVELRFFAGLTIEDTAEALGLSPATVKREWASAKAWLYHRLGGP